MLLFVYQRAGGHFNGICCNCVRDFHDRSMALEENKEKRGQIDAKGYDTVDKGHHHP